MYFDRPFIDPKLARGLVRQELRPLMKAVDSGVHERLANAVYEELNEDFARRNGKIPASMAASAKRRALLRAKDALAPVASYSFKTPIDEEATVAKPADGFLYWLMSHQLVFDGIENEQSYEGHYLELRMHRYMADRRRLLFDDYFCNIMLGQHTLTRMLERGEVSDEPLAAISDNIEDILVFTSLMCMTYAKFHSSLYPQVLIPFGKGAFLAKVVSVNEALSGGYHLRFRVQMGEHGITTSLPPFPAYFTLNQDYRQTTKLIYISSYIGPYEMSVEQQWVVDSLLELMEHERQNLYSYRNLIIASDAMDMPAARLLPTVIEKMKKICSDDRWGYATAKRALYG